MSTFDHSNDTAITWMAWTGWMLFVILCFGIFWLQGPEPDCCENATCNCYEEAP